MVNVNTHIWKGPSGRCPEAGFSLIEMLVVLAILGILLSIMGLNLRPFADPLQDSAARIEGFLKQTRAKAMATTSAYRIHYGSGFLYAERAHRCTDTQWTPDPKLRMQLPDRVSVNWGGSQPVCITSRGYATASRTVVLTDDRGRQKRVTLLIGGAVRVQ